MTRRVLIIAAIVEFVFRGLPAFFAGQAVADFFGLEYMTGFLPYVHAFGAVMLCLGALFFLAARHPEQNRLVVDIAILRFSLGVVAQLKTWAMMGSLVLFWWVHIAIDIILVGLLLAARPKKV